jgi:hypothetical protein
LHSERILTNIVILRLIMRCKLGLLKALFGFGLMVIGLFSCVTEDTPPQGTLSEKDMAMILTEVHLAEARTSQLNLKTQDSSLLVYNHLKNQIWTKLKVDTLVYKESYAFYVTHPNQLERIYDQVKKELEKREQSNTKMEK